MPSLSPSSRLVIAIVAVALLLAIVGAAMHPSTSPASPSPFAEVTASPTVTGAMATLRPTATLQPSPSPRPQVTQAETPSPAQLAPAPPPPTAQVTPTPKPVACAPTDQDQYVYHPDRLAVQAACIRVTGTIEAVRYEADGDLHILLALDPPYAQLLTPANQGVELGDLVVEPVCVRSVSQADAIAICASDPDPLPGPFPIVGQQVRMEGRYVFDLEHGGWAELHPLYRWGPN